jgi:hypothetical protein
MLSIKHISFFTTDFCGLQIPGMESGSSSLLLPPRTVADPGHGSRVPLLRCGVDPRHGSRVLLLRCGGDPGHGSRVPLLRCGVDPGHGSRVLLLRRGRDPGYLYPSKSIAMVARFGRCTAPRNIKIQLRTRLLRRSQSCLMKFRSSLSLGTFMGTLS